MEAGPIDPGPGYRLLARGEIFLEGDEVAWKGPTIWEMAGLAGDACDGFTGFARRPIREQSPGWRWLDTGEIVASSDEANTGLYITVRPGEASAHCEAFRRRTDPVTIPHLEEIARAALQCGQCRKDVERLYECKDIDCLKLICGECRQAHAPRPSVRCMVRMHEGGVVPSTPGFVPPPPTICGESVRARGVTFYSKVETSYGAPIAKLLDGLTRTDRLRSCGCGRHLIDPEGDVYEQHREYTQAALIPEFGIINYATARARGIGVSAERSTLTVLGPDPSGDDVASDVDGAAEYMRGAK